MRATSGLREPGRILQDQNPLAALPLEQHNLSMVRDTANDAVAGDGRNRSKPNASLRATAPQMGNGNRPMGVK
jgi:hypothetical protein